MNYEDIIAVLEWENKCNKEETNMYDILLELMCNTSVKEIKARRNDEDFVVGPAIDIRMVIRDSVGDCHTKNLRISIDAISKDPATVCKFIKEQIDEEGVSKFILKEVKTDVNTATES